MPQMLPFRAYLPAAGLEKRMSALPYDVYDRREARVEALKDPLSFLNIDRPETQFDPQQDIYAPEVYRKARQMLDERREKGLYVQDPEPCFYLYELTMNQRSQTGIVACASVDDYLSGSIRKHENTREDKELDRINHVDVCGAQTGPIFLAYRSDEVLAGLIREMKLRPALFDFTSDDGIRHRGWRIDQTGFQRTIRERFGQMKSVYIADGHHRAASAVKVALKRRQGRVDPGERTESDYFLSVLFSEDELMIMDYNRVVRDLNGHSQEELLLLLSQKCEMNREDQPVHPCQKGEMGMYLAGNWYRLSFREEYFSSDPVEGLDVSLLQKEILTPLLGIKDPRTDERIRFVGGIRGLKELEKDVDECGGVAFSMYPTSIQELFDVADAGRLMPPKSTWFEPKLRSGLFIHEF